MTPSAFSVEGARYVVTIEKLSVLYTYAECHRATGERIVWLIGAVVCLYTAPRLQLLFVSAGNVWLHNALPAATSEIVKRFWTRVSIM